MVLALCSLGQQREKGGFIDSILALKILFVTNTRKIFELQLPESIKSRIIFIRCVSEPLIVHHPVCFSPGIPGKNG